MGIPRRKPLRLEEYDYSQAGYYFVTICTQERECYLGDIRDGKMILSDAGKIVGQIWRELPMRFPFVAMDEFMIMPNHLHGIIFVDPGDHKDRPYNNSLNPRRGESCIRPEPCVRPMSGTKECSLGRVIQGFKSITTHNYIMGVNNNRWPEFHKRLWQRNYFERVIRTNRELDEIRKYIIENPIRWETDKDYVMVKKP